RKAVPDWYTLGGVGQEVQLIRLYPKLIFPVLGVRCHADKIQPTRKLQGVGEIAGVRARTATGFCDASETGAAAGICSKSERGFCELQPKQVSGRFAAVKLCPSLQKRRIAHACGANQTRPGRPENENRAASAQAEDG